MRGVGVCFVAAVAVLLALAGQRSSFANIEKEPAAAQDSEDDEDEDGDEIEESREDKEDVESGAPQPTSSRRKANSAVANIEPDLVPEQILFFSGADIWRNGLFSHSGLLWAYRGLDGDGPVLKLLLNGGLYRYTSGRKEIMGFQAMGAALPGWRWHGPRLEVTAFAGLDAQDHRFLPNDPGNRLRR